MPYQKCTLTSINMTPVVLDVMIDPGLDAIFDTVRSTPFGNVVCPGCARGGSSRGRGKG